MMKSSRQLKTKTEDKAEAPAEAPRPVWFLGKEVKPVAETETQAADASAAPQSDQANASQDRRPSQLEAYMRYAKMRREPEEEEAVVPVRAHRFPPNESVMASNENDTDWGGKAPPKPRRKRRPPSNFRVRDAVLAGVASIAIGTLGGAVVYDRANDGELSTAIFDSIGSFVTGLTPESTNANAGDAAPTSDQGAPTSFKKPIATARLDVSDAKGNVNSPIPLRISAESALPDQDIELRLSGLPADAYLTAGTKLDNNAWVLKPGEEQNVKLMVPSAQASPLRIAVEAIERRTGDLAAPSEEMNISVVGTTPAPATVAAPMSPETAQQVVPASAPPTDVKRNFNLAPASKHESAAAQPIPTPLESSNQGGADSATLMRNGDKLLDIGDFTAARSFFSKARELGNREASLRLGQTYDPVVFRDKNVQGLKPDPALALKYYFEARTAGIADAESAITGLESWLKQ